MLRTMNGAGIERHTCVIYIRAKCQFGDRIFEAVRVA